MFRDTKDEPGLVKEIIVSESSLSDALDIPSQSEIDLALRGVEGLSRVSKADLPPEQLQNVGNWYGNNFSMFFLYLVYLDRGVMDYFVENYVERTENQSEELKRFLIEYAELVASIKELVQQKELITKLLNVYVRLWVAIPILLNSQQSTRGYVSEMETFLQLRLNPLLRQAEAAMIECGVDVDRLLV
jgi:hypothetical protein